VVPVASASSRIAVPPFETIPDRSFHSMRLFSPDTSTPNVRTPAIRRFRSRLSSEWSMRTPTPGALLIVKRVTRCPPPPCSQTATPQLFT